MPTGLCDWTNVLNSAGSAGVGRSPGGGVFASSGMIEHTSLLREFYGHSADSLPNIFGLEDCKSLFTHLQNKKAVAESL